jgi:hypothetical protein
MEEQSTNECQSGMLDWIVDVCCAAAEKTTDEEMGLVRLRCEGAAVWKRKCKTKKNDDDDCIAENSVFFVLLPNFKEQQNNNYMKLVV